MAGTQALDPPSASSTHTGRKLDVEETWGGKQVLEPGTPVWGVGIPNGALTCSATMPTLCMTF